MKIALKDMKKKNGKISIKEDFNKKLSFSSPRSNTAGCKRPRTNQLRRKTTAVYVSCLQQSYTMLYGVFQPS
jgi:hypothetical protein